MITYKDVESKVNGEKGMVKSVFCKWNVKNRNQITWSFAQ